MLTVQPTRTSFSQAEAKGPEHHTCKKQPDGVFIASKAELTFKFFSVSLGACIAMKTSDSYV